MLQFKTSIDHIKKEAQDPHLDANSKLGKLKDLQDALERLQNLRASVIKTEGKTEKIEEKEEEIEKIKGNIYLTKFLAVFRICEMSNSFLAVQPVVRWTALIL